MFKFFKAISTAPAKWRRRSRFEKMLLLEAFFLLGLARVLVLTIPFRWLARTVGQHMQESAPEAAAADLQLAGLIGQAVRSAAGNTPWESVCLPQAIAGQWMLKQRGIAATLYLGVAKADDKPEQLAAHAWLRCGDQILTGGSGHKQFTVVSTFS
jgi:hypothetical protein